MDMFPTTDPVALLRARDGIYADDLLLAAVAHLDVFTALAEAPCDVAHLARRLGVALRPADVMCTLSRAMGVLEPGPTCVPPNSPPSTWCGGRRLTSAPTWPPLPSARRASSSRGAAHRSAGTLGQHRWR